MHVTRRPEPPFKPTWRWFLGLEQTHHQPLLRSVLVRWLRHVYRERLTQGGRWFFWSTLAFTAYGASSLDLQAYIPFSYAFGLWVAAALVLPLCRPRVRVRWSHADRVCAGETLPVELEVEQAGRLPGASLSVVPHRHPSGVEPVPRTGASIPPLARGERFRTHLGLRCNRRGVYRLGGFRAETGYPFGLLLATRTFAEEGPLVVYPRFTRLARLEIPTGRRYQPGGVALASTLGDSFEFIGNREYREGDSIRDMDWHATARLGRPIVREYREEYFLRVAVILDTHVPHRRPPERGADFERAVSLCAGVSDSMARQDYLVDLFAAGPDLYHLTAGRSLAYLDQILDILACVEENPSEPFLALEPELMEGLSRITTVICVLLDWNETRREFVHNLRQQGAALKILIVREGPCTLDPSLDGDALGEIPVLSAADFERGIEEL
jgi:uncharacterized protein (DUF58 family)